VRIAQVSPLFESVPPRLYGGTERVVSYLTEELVRQGHDVTLYASGDSTTSARLVAPCARSLRLDSRCGDALPYHFLSLELLARHANRYDQIHFHTDYLHFPLMRRLRLPHVTTLHGRLDLPDLVPLYREFCDVPLVSISDAQRTPLPWVNWQATVHHGLPHSLLTRRNGDGGYLAFLGRISPEKRVDRAIAIARRAGVPLKIAAKVDQADREYYEAVIKPLLGPDAEYLGEIDEHEKNDFLGQASALLFPIDWPEPFGLVIVEALACGTPVIAWRHGSVPELVDDGVTGFIVEDVDGAVRSVGRLSTIDRQTCRQTFESRFTVTRMAQQYLALYRKLQAARLTVTPTPLRPVAPLSAPARPGGRADA
jgi:glycosyltransferase involved in cell wall biosynthesis